MSIAPIMAGEPFTMANIWVKRPGTGEIKAVHFQDILGKTAASNIAVNEQIRWSDVSGGSAA
ncbi:MAG: SAF domain-containing protein [Thermodesulfobacteriota bacterium]